MNNYNGCNYFLGVKIEPAVLCPDFQILYPEW